MPTPGMLACEDQTRFTSPDVVHMAHRVLGQDAAILLRSASHGSATARPPYSLLSAVFHT